MPLTRATAERSVVLGVGATTLGAAGMAVTFDGETAPNQDLGDPLRRAFDFFGLTPADPMNIVDTDLAQVTPALLGRFLLYLRIMTVEVARTHLATKPRSQKWEDYQIDYGELAKNLASLITSLWQEYRRCDLQLGQPAVGKLDCESTNKLNTDRYFGTNRRF